MQSAVRSVSIHLEPSVIVVSLDGCANQHAAYPKRAPLEVHPQL